MKASLRIAAARKVPVETSELVLQAKIVILEGNQRVEAWFSSAKHLELLRSGQHCYALSIESIFWGVLFH